MLDRIDTIEDYRAALAAGRDPSGWAQVSTTRDHKALIMAIWPGIDGEMEGFFQQAASNSGAIKTGFKGTSDTYLAFPLGMDSTMTVKDGYAVASIQIASGVWLTKRSTYYGPPGLIQGFDFGVILFVPRDFRWANSEDTRMFALRVPFIAPSA